MSRKPEDDKLDPTKDDPTIVRDDTPFPDPNLYFVVFDSEKDEPDSKYRQDVFKLYERWEKKHGRKWPENGLNTEDMVWLYEEAYKDEQQKDHGPVGEVIGRVDGSGPGAAGSSGSRGGKRRFPRTVPKERETYEGEFMTATEDAGVEALNELPADPEIRRQAVLDAKRQVANATWVTDEFESEDYEQGNMELIHDAYLWDGEGRPTVMPSEPPAEELGEGSEEWDEFYDGVRPRHVESDDVRDALWATDEFESDEDNTESEWEPEYVGAGLGLEAEDPINPQYSLRHSNHPLAPFPGEPLKWASYVYDDGTTYEGLTRDAIPHGMGVMMFGNGTGGGFHFRHVKRGDKYEGEFQAGYAHGLGQFTSPNSGEVFIGEFFAGQRHGCGLKIDMAPFYWLVERGTDPVTAYRRTYDKIMRNMEFRTWYRNNALGSDNEEETVLYTVRDDLDNPWDVLARNKAHERKLRNWKALSPEQKVLQKAVEIMEQVHSEGDDFNKFEGAGYNGIQGKDVATQSDTDTYDSIDLQVGNATEGGYGLGWFETEDVNAKPYDDNLAEQIAADVADDKDEESEDKEQVLGDDVLNVTTGLSLRDYLDGNERKHNELMLRALGDDEDTLFEVTEGLDEETVAAALGQKREKKAKMGRYTEDMLDSSIRGYDKLFKEDDPYAKQSQWSNRNPMGEDTETRFETESDMMELCDLAEILGTIDEAEEIVTRARMWRWKPYGEVTLRMAQDAYGQPVETMQDAMHYPHGTKWMAPGPLGQCHPLPEDKSIRLELARVAQNYKHVYEMYNFDWDPEPGSVQYKIDQRIRRAQELQLRRLERMAGAYAELEQGGDGSGAGGSGAQPGALLASAAPLPGWPSSGGPSGSVFASLSSAPGSGGRGGSVFASLSMGPGVGAGGVGLGRASRAVLGTLAKAARRAAPRPRLARPARVQGQQRQGQGQGQGQQAAGAQQRRQQQQQQQQQRQRVQ